MELRIRGEEYIPTQIQQILSEYSLGEQRGLSPQGER